MSFYFPLFLTSKSEEKYIDLFIKSYVVNNYYKNNNINNNTNINENDININKTLNNSNNI